MTNLQGNNGTVGRGQQQVRLAPPPANGKRMDVYKLSAHRVAHNKHMQGMECAAAGQEQEHGAAGPSQEPTPGSRGFSRQAKNGVLAMASHRAPWQLTLRSAKTRIAGG
ncbi:MAG: hypothetical protein FJ100_23350 [Deltaproteobacteria bacterium]|nr:hypothetical protein [Deltaproteobacteria bacterium]